MKRISIAYSIILIVGMILAACAPQVAPQPAQPPPPAAPAATEAPAVAPPAAATAAPAANPTAAPAGVQHVNVPGELPEGKGMFLGDQSTVSSLNGVRALVGDRFAAGRFERPYNANAMDVYFPYLDIVSANLYQDPMWVYARITLVGPDLNGAFPAKYALEVDMNMDGRGDFMVLADYPSTTTWSTDRVQVLKDANHDIGGTAVLMADSGGKGDGYESIVFDSGNGADPDAASARLSPSDAKSVEIAFKTDLLEGDKTYMAGIWAGKDALNPAFFDLNDHYTHAEAGDPNPDVASFYPLKALAELDNTCRQAMGFVPSGKEPGICSQGQ